MIYRVGCHRFDLKKQEQSERLPPQAFGPLLLTKEERCDVLT